MAETIFFIILSVIAVVSALFMITRKHPLSSALSLVITFIALAGLYALVSAKLVFLMQILVYTGAIMSIIIFTIMLLNLQDEDLPKEPKIYTKIAFSMIFVLPVLLIMYRAILFYPDSGFPAISESYGSVSEVGMSLFQKYAFPFEIISILLLVALVGVVVLAKRRV